VCTERSPQAKSFAPVLQRAMIAVWFIWAEGMAFRLLSLSRQPNGEIRTRQATFSAKV